ncbi:MAG TPA: hypothetical protein VFE48_25620 [Methylomirabilota bacterium]|nr:hypothetical protein [Methylomirabilota bacterium]
MLAARRRFDFDRDTFAFANQLVWEYRFDEATGASTVRRRVPPPDYALRCFVLVRAVRLFFQHARFDPGAERVDDATYRRLVREVLRRNPRRPSEPAERVVIPGFVGLREMSVAREGLLKAACGGAWRSYVQRSHWHILVPVSRSHQHRTALRLLEEVRDGGASIVHLLRFPSLAINHGMVIFEGARTPDGARFLAYDPNQPERPARLTYDRGRRTFSMPFTGYWRGGDLNVFEIFRRWYL